MLFSGSRDLHLDLSIHIFPDFAPASYKAYDKTVWMYRLAAGWPMR